ncbi:MAG: type II toxin-antitoxin system PemK/MazF family toxin [Verrucomicrobia bacterium]|nr:type II toxin-antitoxin system PemK/MazF family toxin [Verrucomicrobiota bacterium]
MLQRGEIFICSFPFTSGQFSKPRPALVLMDLGNDSLICRVTSTRHSGPLEIEILDWQAAGLLKPSTARLTRLVSAEKHLLQTKIGELSPADLQRVRQAWNQHMKL